MMVRIIKRMLLVLIGFLPFLLGYFQNELMLGEFRDVVFPFWIPCLLLLAFWFLIGALFVNLIGNKTETMVFLNAVAAFVLMLLLYQEIILKRYWMNQIGLATQMFYLPLLRLGFTLTPMFHRVFYAYSAGFLCLLGSSFLGCSLGDYVGKRTQGVLEIEP